MSALALAYALDQTIGDGHAKHVLIHLANRHHPDTGRCFPSIERIAVEAELSTATVSRKLELLEKLGLIEVISRRDAEGRALPNGYLLTFVPPPSQIDDAPQSRARGLPPRDYQPTPETIAMLKEEFPHHDVDALIPEIVREFIDWTYADGRMFARVEEGFRNSARRQLRRAGAVAGGGHPRPRQGRGGAVDAARALLDRKLSGS